VPASSSMTRPLSRLFGSWGWDAGAAAWPGLRQTVSTVGGEVLRS
jgi:hypothetical protein